MGTFLRVTPALAAVAGALLDAWPEQTWGLAICAGTGRPSGTVYPLLERLERYGLLTSEWDTDEVERRGPRRRLYRLTDDGLVWARAVTERGGRK
ncbi:helix-turn-helix transcriptional regulator [Demequina lutea]|uniref:DNA-binding IclR family transcriptional regulator n=1 Tax=Demequina lutea TaxID=431489 RepID=A0A7Z0CKN4_9MICO|nr:helix-turn-helix transcriptional regulator [Demequina lutea]NYI42032.1 DNA-binding IclR family transcriptional regulator [Demequina lutea]